MVLKNYTPYQHRNLSVDICIACSNDGLDDIYYDGRRARKIATFECFICNSLTIGYPVRYLVEGYEDNDGEQIVRKEFERGTFINYNSEGCAKDALAMCSDGKKRRLTYIANGGKPNDDFMIPCGVLHGTDRKYIKGFIKVETSKGYDQEMDNDRFMVKFIVDPTANHKDLLPEGFWRAN